MKLFEYLLPVTVPVLSQDWIQPKYSDALKSVNQRKSGWGFPIGVRSAAEWSLCPALTKPSGVASIQCDGSTCMQICEAGKLAMGQRRTKCRFKKKSGFSWKKVLRLNTSGLIYFLAIVRM